ncbi:MAG: helix-turn-helix transcriptional regulator [Clostridia bacterium]|nr:helix-turn-helix transcriptional regulator [Clostridia bacterium]
MKQNKFDLVMDYVDANIEEDVETIKKGIYRLIGYNSNTFGNCFSVLTGKTLFHYINERKMYFAAQALQKDLDRSIADIGLEYGYSEQSSFSRAFKLYCKATPNDVKKGIANFPDRKYRLANLCENNKSDDARLDRIIRELKETGDLSMSNWNYLEKLEEASRESVFDIDTCGAISDLAEKLEIPFWRLLHQCENIVLDIQSDPDYLPPRIEKAIDCGISSDMELKEICDYYNCKYYDLDEFMVEAYREQLNLK